MRPQAADRQFGVVAAICVGAGDRKAEPFARVEAFTGPGRFAAGCAFRAGRRARLALRDKGPARRRTPPPALRAPPLTGEAFGRQLFAKPPLQGEVASR